MEDLREERDWEKYSSAPLEEIYTGGWLWNKGLGLGKKIVISGIMISFAPLVLPPLFAVSTLGFALLIPCRFLFATYASTRILMSYLLPTLGPSQILSDDENNFDEGDGVNEQLSFEENREKGDKKDENAGKHEDNMEVEQVIEVVDTNEMNKGSKKISDVEEGKMEEDTKDLKDEDIEKTNKETIKKAENPSESKKKKVNKQAGARKKDTETTNGKAVKPVEESQGAEKKVTGKYLDRKDESTVNKSVMATSEVLLISFGAYVGESSPSDDMKSTNTADHPALVSVAPRSSYGKGSTRRSNKVIYSEAEIWENIGVLRKIVGYRVEPQSKITEELKAIYQYTGVEPPESFKDDSTFVDLDDKLRFLMSVVGFRL